jgi:acyl-CoA thioesterase-1
MKNYKKILFISDSTALPRPGVEEKYTWPSLIRKNIQKFDILLNAERNRTSNFLVNSGFNNLESFEIYEPDIVIINLGICDCSKRINKKIEKINNIFIKLFKINIIKLMSNKLIQNLYKSENAHVNLQQYIDNLKQYEKKITSKKCKLYLIQILCCENIKTNFYGLYQQVNIYNRKIEDEFNNKIIINVSEINKDIKNFLDDGYHLSRRGHHKLYTLINNILYFEE